MNRDLDLPRRLLEGQEHALQLARGGMPVQQALEVLVRTAEAEAKGRFLGSILLTGVGYSLLFSAGVGIAAELAPAEHRAGTVSAVYFFGYAVQAVAAIGLGQLATAGASSISGIALHLRPGTR